MHFKCRSISTALKPSSLILYLIFTLFTSCSVNQTFNKVTLVKGTRLVQSKKNTATQDVTLNTYKLSVATDAVIELKENELRIEPLRSLTTGELEEASKITESKDRAGFFGVGKGNETKFRIPTRYQYNGILLKYLKDKELLYEDLREISSPYRITSKLKMNSSKWISQAISIPIKIRPEVDSFDYEVTTGVNAGFAYGRKWSRRTIQPIYHSIDDKMIGYDEVIKSVSLAGFIGPTTVKLTESNTQNSINSDRTVLGINLGLSAIFELNKFNAGLAVGWDSGFGSDTNTWIYNWEPWYGIVIGFEIIK